MEAFLVFFRLGYFTNILHGPPTTWNTAKVPENVTIFFSYLLKVEIGTDNICKNSAFFLTTLHNNLFHLLLTFLKIFCLMFLILFIITCSMYNMWYDMFSLYIQLNTFWQMHKIYHPICSYIYNSSLPNSLNIRRKIVSCLQT